MCFQVVILINLVAKECHWLVAYFLHHRLVLLDLLLMTVALVLGLYGLEALLIGAAVGLKVFGEFLTIVDFPFWRGFYHSLEYYHLNSPCRTMMLVIKNHLEKE